MRNIKAGMLITINKEHGNGAPSLSRNDIIAKFTKLRLGCKQCVDSHYGIQINLDAKALNRSTKVARAY
jgi:hypothetical protein